MSRSYKRTPIIKDRSSNYRRYAKKQANRKVRRSKGVPNGKQYRKFYETWDIYDYVSYGGTLVKAADRFEKGNIHSKSYSSRAEYEIAWKRWFYYK